MAIYKATNPAPLGENDDELYGIPETEFDDDIEVVLEDDENVEVVLEDDDVPDFDANLAEHMDETVLNKLAGELVEDYEADIASRKDWVQTYVDGLELLGLKIEERTEPWDGACGVFHPILSEAVVKFQAETMMETFPASGPVKTKIIGEESAETIDAAERVRQDMNFQLLENMVEYRPEHERMLWGLGLSGNAFKKVYYDPYRGRQISVYVPAEDVVVPYGESDLQTAERITHIMRKTPNEVRRLQKAGFYRDIELDEPKNTLDDIEKQIAEQMGFSATTDDRHKLLEMQVVIDLAGYEDTDENGEETNIALPYIVTIEKGSSKILAIRRNWREDDEFKEKRNHFVHYSYIPGFGFYAFGLIHLIGAFAKSGTSLIRQLVDAGTLSNLPGGFKTKGLRIKGDDEPIGPAEFRDVDVASGTLKDNILPLPYKEPSTVLYNLLTTIVEEGRRFASVPDMKVADMSSESPVGTTLAILERSLKVMSAVQARIHYAMKQEFKLLRDIIRDYTDGVYTYKPHQGENINKKEDYNLVEILPVSDPNSSTLAHKVVQYQAVLQLSQTAPDLYDLPFLHRQMLQVLGIKEAEKIVPIEDDMKPMEPVAENMAILNGKPVKAFIYQDHESHITVHMAASQDPVIMEMVGQSPMASKISASMQAHIAEHLAFAYRKQIEEQAGVPYPGPEEELSEEKELQISRLAAAAAQQLLQKHQAEKAQKDAQAMAENPVIQMQMKELELKEQDQQLKEKKMVVDAVDKADKNRIAEEAIKSRERIAGVQTGAKVGADKANLLARQQEAGLKLGVDLAEKIGNQERGNRQDKTEE